MKQSEIALFGDLNVDFLMSIPTYPLPGGDAMADQITLRPGGSVTNTAVVLAKLGSLAKMIGRTGEDHWAEIALEPLISTGVDITCVSQDPLISTGLIFIPVTSNGERTMFSYRGANINKSPDEITDEIFTDVQLLHVSAYNFLESPQKEATWQAIEIALRKGIRITMDVGVEPVIRAKGAIEELMPKLSVLVLGFDEAQEMIVAHSPMEAAKLLIDAGVEVIGLKLGKNGCVVANSKASYLFPGFEVETVDTTGAGDAFNAGLIFGLHNGWHLSTAGMLANILGALATTVWGGGPVLPGVVDVQSFIEERVNVLEDGYIRNLMLEVGAKLNE
jgi:ribokinase